MYAAQSSFELNLIINYMIFGQIHKIKSKYIKCEFFYGIGEVLLRGYLSRMGGRWSGSCFGEMSQFLQTILF